MKLLIGLIFLSGCYIKPAHWNICKKLCEPNQGIKTYYDNALSSDKCICNNSAKFYIGRDHNWPDKKEKL